MSLKGVLISILLTAAMLVVLKGFLFEVIVVADPMMGPGLVQEDWFVGIRYTTDAKPGDLVALTAKNRDYVRRIAATAGQEVKLDKGVLVVDSIQRPTTTVTEGERFSIPRGNGTADERKANRLTEQLGGKTYEIWVNGRKPATTKAQKVPPDHVFVLCDNRDYCKDSRHFGPVHLDDVWAVRAQDFL